MNSASSFRIEQATAADIPLVLALIRELAEFERLLPEARATEADLRETLFGDRPFAEVVVGRVGSEAAGFALFFHNYSTFLGKPGIYLEDLFVRPAHRGKGFGEQLLRHLAQLAVQRGCGRFEWSVLDWNQQAIDFYKKLGAQPLSDWTTFRVTGEVLQQLAGEAE
jgi:GNAT superfamily N-acetyltransferase